MSYSWPLLAALLISSWSGPEMRMRSTLRPWSASRPTSAAPSARFASKLAAEPIELQAEDPLIYTVTITANMPARHAPHRPRLQDFPALKESFYLEDLGPPEGSRPNDHTWEFAIVSSPKIPTSRLYRDFPSSGTSPAFVGAWVIKPFTSTKYP